MPIGENAVPRYFVNAADSYIPNPQYRGEAYFLGADEASGDVGQYAFGPNSITVPVTVREPGILVINQNYHPAWQTDRGELLDREGLIAVRLRETGSYAVRLSYLPRSFVTGLAVTVLSIAAWALGCFAIGDERRGRGRAAQKAGGPERGAR
jgi:hypothetical protein